MSKSVAGSFKVTHCYDDNGRLHREDGPAIEYEDGEEWYIDGVLHRVDGPAIIYEGEYKAWWFNGKRHRLDGPAVEFDDDNKEWWFDGRRIYCTTQEEFEHAIRLSLFW